MADLSTLFPNFDVGSFGPVAGMAMGDMFNMAKRNNQINQDRALQEYTQNEALNPIAVQQAQANVGHTNALTGQAQAATNRSIFDLEQDQRLKEPKYQAALAGFLKDTTEAEVKQAHAKLESDLMSTDPKVRAQAQQLYKGTGDMLKMYEQLRIQGENSARVAQIGADGRVAAKNAGAGSGRVPRTLQEQYTSYLNQAENAETPEESQRFQQMADIVFKKMVELGNARSAPMAVTPDGKFVPNPGFNPGTATPTQLPPKPGEASPKPKAQHSMSQLKQMYPGKSDSEIKAAYKAKFGVEPE